MNAPENSFARLPLPPVRAPELRLATIRNAKNPQTHVLTLYPVMEFLAPCLFPNELSALAQSCAKINNMWDLRDEVSRDRWQRVLKVRPSRISKNAMYKA